MAHHGLRFDFKLLGHELQVCRPYLGPIWALSSPYLINFKLLGHDLQVRYLAPI